MYPRVKSSLGLKAKLGPRTARGLAAASNMLRNQWLGLELGGYI